MANIIDRALEAISPVRAEKRERARLRMMAVRDLKNSYDGASRTRRTTGWRAVSTDANTETMQSLARLRDVARDMCRNNPYAARAKQAIATNTVGKGIIPSIISKDKRTRDRLETLLKSHFDTTACDAAGRHDLYGLQAMIMATVVESGECLVRRRPRRPEDGLPLPFQLEVLEPDYLDTTKNGRLANGGWQIQGIEYSPIGQLVGYWLFSEHPGSASIYSMSNSKLVPAEFVAHVYRQDRPQQARGVSWFAPVMLRMRDFADFADAQLMRQKIAACFAVFITGNGEMSGIVNEEDQLPAEMIEPGMIERLRDGDSVEFANPPGVGDFSQYASATLHEIAAGLGVSYEALTGDLSGVNFSSGRMGWLEFQRTIDSWRDLMLKPQFLHRVSGWFLDAAGIVSGRAADVQWTAPRREMIMPAQEVPAIVSAIRAGLTSRSEEQRKLGYDPADLDAEIASDNTRADELGLTLESDARKVTAVGNPVNAAQPQPTTN